MGEISYFTNRDVMKIFILKQDYRLSALTWYLHIGYSQYLELCIKDLYMFGTGTGIRTRHNHIT